MRLITMDLRVFYYRANSEVAGVSPVSFFYDSGTTFMNAEYPIPTDNINSDSYNTMTL